MWLLLVWLWLLNASVGACSDCPRKSNKRMSKIESGGCWPNVHGGRYLLHLLLLLLSYSADSPYPSKGGRDCYNHCEKHGGWIDSRETTTTKEPDRSRPFWLFRSFFRSFVRSFLFVYLIRLLLATTNNNAADWVVSRLAHQTRHSRKTTR